MVTSPSTIVSLPFKYTSLLLLLAFARRIVLPDASTHNPAVEGIVNVLVVVMLKSASCSYLNVPFCNVSQSLAGVVKVPVISTISESDCDEPLFTVIDSITVYVLSEGLSFVIYLTPSSKNIKGISVKSHPR